MKKLFEHEGRIFMEVIPVKALFHSGLIHDVITSGRKFVVDMNTGELTIHGDPQKKIVKNNPRYKPHGKPTVKISEEWEIANIQLSDQFNIGNVYGMFYYGPPNNRRKVEVDGFKTIPDFLFEVRRLYGR